MVVPSAASSSLWHTQAEARPFQNGVAESIDRAKQLLKMGATAYFTINEGEIVGRALNILVWQTIDGDCYTQEKPEKHALSKYPQYSMTPDAFYEKLKDNNFFKKFENDCNQVLAALRKIENGCRGEEKAEVDKAVLWLSKLLEKMKQYS